MAPAQLLQAVEITFSHPRTRKKMTFSVPLEKPFAEAVQFLEKECLQSAPTFDEDTSFRDFAETEINNPYLEEEIVEDEEEYPYEEEPVKERLTRAERLEIKKERRKKRKAIEAEKREKKERRDAEKRGETYVPKSEIVTGYEPTIDPSFL